MALRADGFLKGYNICPGCGGQKSASSPLCYGCTYPIAAEQNTLWTLCECGRRKRSGHKVCPVCDYHPEPVCDLPRVRAHQRGFAWCDLLLPHSHCYACGEACAVNWPYCSGCESRAMGLSLVQEEGARESHGDHGRVDASKGRRRKTLSV